MKTKYILKELLGEGGMSKVYLAENHIGKKIAIKFLKEEFIYNNAIRNRFIEEAKHMIQVNSPYFINIIDLIQETDECAIVMEYFDGVTLKEYISKRKILSIPEVIELFTSILNAVENAHSLGLIHRDIKPSNFMIGINNTIKLMDFGVAKNINNSNLEFTQTVINTSIGTPLYMSPEQVKGMGNITYSSDIYSLGVLLWEMINGVSLYDKKLSINEINAKILKENLPNTNSVFNHCIIKATNKVPNERFENVNAFKKEFIKLANKKNGLTSPFNLISNNQNNLNTNEIKNQLKKISKFTIKEIFVTSLSFVIILLTIIEIYVFKNSNEFSYLIPFIFIYILLSLVLSSFSSKYGLIDYIENWNKTKNKDYLNEYNFENKLIFFTQLIIVLFSTITILFYFYLDFYRVRIYDIILITILQAIFLIRGNFKNWL